MLAYTLGAAATGIVSGFWFCIGSVFASSETIAELATSYWDYNKAHADEVVAQSAQYAVGAVLLVTAFVLQVLGALASPFDYLVVPQYLAHPLVFLLLVMLTISGISYPGYRLLLRVKGARVHSILEQRIKRS